MSEAGCIVVLTKPAIPGRVKTRLIGESLSAARTARLHEAFLGDLLARLGDTSHALRIAWALDPGEVAPMDSPPGFAQEGSDLGERLYRALRRAATSHRLVAAVGSDHPEMPAARAEEAFARLAEGTDMVFGPAADGGYYLVAAKRETLQEAVFAEIPWSTDAVLERTLERCGRLGLTTDLLELGHDVDTAEDLPRLSEYLRHHPEDCPRTRDLLSRWGLLAAL